MINIMTLKDSSTDVHLENTISVIKKADNKLFILAGCLSGAFTNDNRYIYELSNFIEKPNSHLEILLSNYKEDNARKYSKLLRRLAYYISSGYQERIIIKQFFTSLTFTEDDKKEPIHFLLNDVGGYCISSNYLSENFRFADRDGFLSEILLKGFSNIFEQANILDILTLFNTSDNDTSK